MGRLIAIAALLAGLSSVPARADGERATTTEYAARAERSCGGDAFSFAEVVSGRGAKGIVSTVPDTLCADLDDPRGPAIGSLNVVIEPRRRAEREGDRETRPRMRP